MSDGTHIENIRTDDVIRLVNILADIDMSAALDGQVCIQQHRDACNLAHELLVGYDNTPGQSWVGPHWPHISVLRDRGFIVAPGDRDSMGWLTGVVHTPHSDTWVLFG